MKVFESFKSKINESVEILESDWLEMYELMISANFYPGPIVNKIKDKDTAIARFVCGLRLINGKIRKRKDEYIGKFSEFGNRALELGATHDEIEYAYDSIKRAPEWAEQFHEVENNGLDNVVSKPISKYFLEHYYNIESVKVGPPLTAIGNNTRIKNPSQWSLGFKYVIADENDKTFKFNIEFDVIMRDNFTKIFYVLGEGSDEIFPVSNQLLTFYKFDKVFTYSSSISRLNLMSRDIRKSKGL